MTDTYVAVVYVFFTAGELIRASNVLEKWIQRDIVESLMNDNHVLGVVHDVRA